MSLNTITFSTDLALDLASFLKNQSYSKIGLLADENTAELCYPIIKPYLPEHTFLQIKSGEEHKTLQTCSQIWEWMTENQFDRKALLINLGGGVIGDMGGFCAASYKRGCAFINLPTTLLAQVDASIGGKLGIDFMGYKNHIGFFKTPDHVFISPLFLSTLPERELRSGFAEVIKHALIADKTEWEKLQTKTIKDMQWEKQVRHSVHIKNAVVEQDPTEKGLRKILNFGHTVGHAIESFYLHTPDRLLHGEAIAIGMLCEAWLSHKLLKLSAAELAQISQYILKTFGKVNLNPAHYEQITALALQDKKNLGHTINCVLLPEAGKAGYDQPVSQKDIQEALVYYSGLA